SLFGAAGRPAGIPEHAFANIVDLPQPSDRLLKYLPPGVESNNHASMAVAVMSPHYDRVTPRRHAQYAMLVAHIVGINCLQIRVHFRHFRRKSANNCWKSSS